MRVEIHWKCCLHAVCNIYAAVGTITARVVTDRLIVPSPPPFFSQTLIKSQVIKHGYMVLRVKLDGSKLTFPSNLARSKK